MSIMDGTRGLCSAGDVLEISVVPGVRGVGGVLLNVYVFLLGAGWEV